MGDNSNFKNPFSKPVSRPVIPLSIGNPNVVKTVTTKIVTRELGSPAVPIKKVAPVINNEVKRSVFGLPPEPIVRERRLWNMNNIIIAFIIGAVLIIVEFLSVPVFKFSPLNAIILGLVLLVIYAVVLFFLLEPKVMREVFHTKTEIREVPKEVIVEKIVEKPITEKIIQRVYTEKEVPHIIERTVFKPVPVKPIDILNQAYVGSTETKVYHKRTCRLSKLIKDQYKIQSNNEEFFKDRKFRPCEVCVLERKKV
ncbi:MAG: phage holin family protein [archaeon]|nr:phage holin family protein [archaeon]